MAFAPEEVKKTIFTTLGATAALTSALGGASKIYDHAPDGVAFPYVTIGVGDNADFRGSEDTDGWNHTVMIHVWTQNKGSKQALNIQEIISTALHRKELSFASFTNLSLLRDFQTVLVEDDNVTYHGVQRFLILTGE
jgi:hypothetical protein